MHTRAISGGDVLIGASDLRMQLRRGLILKLKEARGARLGSAGGIVWITVERVARDIVLRPGDSFIVPSDGLVLVDPLSGTVTLDVKGARDAGSVAPAGRFGAIAKIAAFIGLQRRLDGGVA
jgi:hypothetical protein